MTKRTIGLLALLMCTLSAGALEFEYSVYVAPGASIALGGDLATALEEFTAVAGSEALYAPVLGAAIGIGTDMAILEALRVAGNVEMRRVGYALWAPESGASTWLTLWMAGLKLGIRYQPEPWYLGAGAFLCAPVSGVSQARSQGGASLNLNYDVEASRMLVPGAYLEGGISLGFPIPLGPVYLRPRLGLEAGLWPQGILDDVESWQTALSAVITIGIARRLVR